MTDHPIDFSPLDPRRDPDRFDGLIRHVVARGLPPPVSPLTWSLARLFAPGFATALVLALVFGGLAARVPDAGRDPGAATATAGASESATTAAPTGPFAFASWAADGSDDPWTDLEMLRR